VRILFIGLLISCASWGSTTYQLIWKNHAPLDMKYQLFELAPAFSEKVGTQGSILSPDQLMPVREFKNHQVEFKNQKSLILALVAQSPSGNAFDFYVAPHHTHPDSAGLDFKFNCLCYHHIYHLEKGKLWYRIMRLSHTSKAKDSKQVIKLEHDLIPWKAVNSDSKKK